MQYNKLVRDKIPEIIKNTGKVPFVHIADEKEYEEALDRKLHEEVAEFLEKPCLEEVADILEVLYAICSAKNIDQNQIEIIRQKKLEERGGFKERTILERTEEI